MSIFIFILLLDQKINESSCQKGDFKGLGKALPSGPAQPLQKKPSGNQVCKMRELFFAGHDGRDLVLWSKCQITECVHEDISQHLRGLSLPVVKPISNFLRQMQLCTLQPTLV